MWSESPAGRSPILPCALASRVTLGSRSTPPATMSRFGVRLPDDGELGAAAADGANLIIDVSGIVAEVGPDKIEHAGNRFQLAE